MDYDAFKNSVHDLINLDLNSYKEQQMHRRILQWISRYNLGDFAGLISKLRMDSEHRQKFLDYLTINTSHFFRDQIVFSYIETDVLPAISGPNARIWSAGCSIGAEPYSIVMLLLTHQLQFREIIATDIDEESLEKARAGVYPASQINQVPEDFLQRYFLKVDDRYELAEEVKRHVKFSKHNLLINPYPQHFDLILCRNVFIYFTAEIQKKLIERFVHSLKPKGFFIVGSAEHIINPKQYGLERVSYCVYRKQ